MNRWLLAIGTLILSCGIIALGIIVYFYIVNNNSQAHECICLTGSVMAYASHSNLIPVRPSELYLTNGCNTEQPYIFYRCNGLSPRDDVYSTSSTSCSDYVWAMAGLSI